MPIPQIIITLSPQGGLQCELPMNGQRRVIAISQDADGIATLSRILHAQLRNTSQWQTPDGTQWNVEGILCGTDGKPSQYQVTHWERHAEWPSDTCVICKSEGRVRSPKAKRNDNKWTLVGDGSCKVRRVAPQGKTRKLTARSATASKAQDIGLSI